MKDKASVNAGIRRNNASSAKKSPLGSIESSFTPAGAPATDNDLFAQAKARVSTKAKAEATKKKDTEAKIKKVVKAKPLKPTKTQADRIDEAYAQTKAYGTDISKADFTQNFLKLQQKSGSDKINRLEKAIVEAKKGTKEDLSDAELLSLKKEGRIKKSIAELRKERTLARNASDKRRVERLQKQLKAAKNR